MITYMLVRHKVKDFKAWKQAYEAHLPKRVEAGLTEAFLFRNADNSNEVVILFEAKDLARAKAFADSADLRETMVKAGVVDKPDIFFLNDQYSTLKAVSGF
jgi:predicted RND superfamily exporter protein